MSTGFAARRTAVVIASVLVFVVAVHGAPSGAVEARRPGHLLEADGPVALSPNGDGRQDAVTVRYRLGATAVVQARIIYQGRTVRTFRVGRVGAGSHALRWDGTRAPAHTVRDGRYTLRIRATRGSRFEVTETPVQVDTALPTAGSPTANRWTVYPRTTLFADVVRIRYPYMADFEGAGQVAVAVRRPDGSLVKRLTADDCPPDCWMTTWDGQDGSGKVVAAGSYLVRAAISDAAGNRRVARSTVVVSDETLVEHTSTTTVAADQPTGRSENCGMDRGNDCPVAHCAAVASERFTGGLSFRSGLGCGAFGPSASTAGRYYVVAGETGHEQFRVTATGGPTTPGASDTASLTGTAMQGDGTFSTPWLPIAVEYGRVGGVGRWYAEARGGNRYDVASYTIEQTYFAPAS